MDSQQYFVRRENAEDASRWHVAYTYPRHEKAVTEHLKGRSFEIFLPTYRHANRWKDRRVVLELPLFPGYVFARFRDSERGKVLAVPGIIRILSQHGRPAPVSDAEIDAIRICVTNGTELERHHFVAVGDRVRVREGSFEGLEGFVVRNGNGQKVVVSISLIRQSVALEIDSRLLEAVGPKSAVTPMQVSVWAAPSLAPGR